jgi:uncharacterized protein
MEEKLSLRARLMMGVSNLIYRHHWLVLGAVAALTVFHFVSSRYLGLKLNFTDMLSPTAPAVVNYKEAVRQFGALSFLFVVLEVDRPEDLDRAKAYADELARRLPEKPEFVPRVFYKIELKDYLDDGLLYVPTRDLTMLADLAEKNHDPIAAMVRAPGLASAIEGLNTVLASYTESGEVPELKEGEIDFKLMFDPLQELVGSFKDYAENGPHGQMDRVKTKLLGSAFKSSRDLPIDLSESYIIGKDRKHILMFVSTTKPAEDFEWCRQLLDYAIGVNAEVSKSHPGVKARFTGNAAFMNDDNRIIRNDMNVTTIVAFVAIMALFAWSFRNLSSILMVGIPLAIGIVWAMGSAYWLIGHLTPVTAVFGAILLGMGVDYGILILSRYSEERQAGKTIKEALDIAMVQAGGSIITGATATALAFASMRLAKLKAGQEMGILAAAGILQFVVIMIFGVGSLLVIRDKLRKGSGPGKRQWDPYIMRQVAAGVDRFAVPVVVVFGLVIGGLAYFAPRYSFEYNYLNLEPAGVESFELVHKIPEWFNIDVNFGMIVSRSVEEDRKLAAELREDKAVVSRVDAVSDFIPTDQEQKLAQVARLKASLDGIEAATADGDSAEATAPAMSEADFERLLTALKALRDTIGAPGRGLIGVFYMAELEDAEDGARELLASLNDLIATLESKRGESIYRHLGQLDRRVRLTVAEGWKQVRTMTGATGVNIETMRRKHPEQLERFLGRDGSFMIYVFPSVTIWDENNLIAVAGGLKRIAEENHTQAMGVAMLFEEILRVLKSDLFRIAAVALLIVFGILLLNYRGLWHTLLTLIPLLAGGAAMVGLMNLLGLKFNIVNTGMLPLLIGVGVDYGVYVVHRWIDEGKGLNSIRPTVESTGRAVTLAALTTMIGFAAVILCKWRGLSLMGATMTMGIGLCWLVAIIFLPAVLKIIEMIKARRGGV